VANRSFDLLTKHCCRSTLLDEAEKFRPEMTRVIKSFSFPCDREGRTWTGAGSNGPVIGPSGESECVGPSADPGEEVMLDKSFNVFCLDINNTPLIDLTRRNQPGLNQLP
jgi:hypothetical protein